MQSDFNISLKQSREQSSIPIKETAPSLPTDLPEELLSLIFSNLGQRDLQACSITCKQWSRICAKEIEIREKSKLLSLYGEKIIGACGGIDAFYQLPELKLEKTNQWKVLAYAGTISLEILTSPIMRGIYYDGTPFVTIHFSYSKKNSCYNNALTFFGSNNKFKTSESIGRLDEPFSDYDDVFEKEKDFNELKTFIHTKERTQKKANSKTITFNITKPTYDPLNRIVDYMIFTSIGSTTCEADWFF